MYYYFNVDVQEHKAWIKYCVCCLLFYVNFCNESFILIVSVFSNVEKVISYLFIC